jgi:hypothetical protein
MTSQHSIVYNLTIAALCFLTGGVFLLFQLGVHSFGIKDQVTLKKLRTGLGRWATLSFFFVGCVYLVEIWL